MRKLLRGVFAMCAVLAVAACGADQVVCTAIGAQVGIGVDVAAPLVQQATRAAIEVCWDGNCTDQSVDLYDATTSVDQGCEGNDPDDTCSAQVEPTGGKYGFVELPNLPEAPVVLTVSLEDSAGKQISEGTTTLTPTRVYPNGPDCGGDGIQATVTIDSTGALSSP